MGNVGLALAWETRIPAIAQRERRLEPYREQIAAPDRGAEATQNEDLALAAACLSGDLRAYERLYSLHGRRMKNLARNILGSSTDAEDAVQETFLKVQRSIASFRGQSSFVTWIFRILVNTCYDARRSRLRKKEVAAEGEQQHGELAPRPEPRAAVAHPSLRLALERGGLAAGGAERRAIAEELADHQDRKYERIKEYEVMAAPEEEQQVEPVDRKACPEQGIPDPAALALAALNARDDEHRDTAPDEDQGIQVEHLQYLAVATRPRGR